MSLSSGYEKGEISITLGFVAQYAAEAVLATPGVNSLDSSLLINIKEKISGEHEGKGVLVSFNEIHENSVRITVFPIIYYGNILPEIAWNIQQRVKKDVEKYTGLTVDEVNVHIKRVVMKQQDN